MTESPAGQALAPAFRYDVLQLTPPRLLASECVGCGLRIFPRRDFCPRCTEDRPPRGVTLSETGTVFSYTVVHQAPAGWPTPYTLAYVDLDDGVRVLAQLLHPPDKLGKLDIGLRVRLTLKPMLDASGEARTIYAFSEIESDTGSDE